MIDLIEITNEDTDRVRVPMKLTPYFVKDFKSLNNYEIFNSDFSEFSTDDINQRISEFSSETLMTIRNESIKELKRKKGNQKIFQGSKTQIGIILKLLEKNDDGEYLHTREDLIELFKIEHRKVKQKIEVSASQIQPYENNVLTPIRRKLRSKLQQEISALDIDTEVG